jgi:hypothetical protein
VGRNIETPKPSAIVWEQANVAGSLTALRVYVEQQADDAITWYLDRKRSKASFSRYMRGGVIVATALGALFPIGANVFGAPGWLQSGLVPALLVGVAAALLGADKAFGFSTGWIRYITTAAVIRKALEEFRLEWLLRTSQLGAEPSREQIAELVQTAKTFRLSIEGLVIDETKAWAVEFQNTLAQLEKDTNEKFEQVAAQVREQARSQAPGSGSIEVSLPNSAAADDGTVKIEMEGEGVSVVDTIAGSRRWSRIGLKPGHYRLVVSAQAGRKPVHDQTVCEIRAGELLKTELKLPIGQ